MYFQNSALREGFFHQNIVHCNVFLDRALSWNWKTTSDVLAAPNPKGNYSVRVDTDEYGITINFVVSGSFGYFSFAELLTALVDIVIILKLPLKIIELVCFHMLGTRSRFYRNAIIEKFYLPTFVCGLIGRKIGYGSAFQTLSKQLHCELGDLQKLEHNDFTRLVAKFLKQYGRNDALDDNEIETLGSFLFAAFDMDDSGTVGMNEWITAAGFNEPMQLHDVAMLFDEDRKLSLGEHVFDDGITRFIKKAHDKNRASRRIADAELQGAVDPDITEGRVLVKADLDALELKLQARINALETRLTEAKNLEDAQELNRQQVDLSVHNGSMLLHPDLSQNESTPMQPTQQILRQHEESAVRIQKLERALEQHLEDSRQLINQMFEENLHQVLGDKLRASEQITGAATNGGKLTLAEEDKITGLVFDVAEMKGALNALDRQVETLSSEMRSQQANASRHTLAPLPQVYPPMLRASMNFVPRQPRVSDQGSQNLIGHLASLQTSRSTSHLVHPSTDEYRV
eukprot:TRINITY_DN4572_c0_g1_i3.p1 TRINITY_DN4572_c0_g1~~TRINITY_DN4572_c0_g1_i3.p1  ORF type:complete len:593 (-),score=100.20 TRINITY_DN4572_c0_g1_i3:59-1603(-)